MNLDYDYYLALWEAQALSELNASLNLLSANGRVQRRKVIKPETCLRKSPHDNLGANLSGSLHVRRQNGLLTVNINSET